MEKRSQKRHFHKASIVYNTDPMQNSGLFGAETINYSKEGVCLLSSHILDPESDIYIAWTDLTDLPEGLFNIKDAGSVIYDEQDYRACKGSVVWCREIAGNGAFCYRNGVRIEELDIKLL